MHLLKMQGNLRRSGLRTGDLGPTQHAATARGALAGHLLTTLSLKQMQLMDYPLFPGRNEALYPGN
jgi:hypothetical protein